MIKEIPDPAPRPIQLIIGLLQRLARLTRQRIRQHIFLLIQQFRETRNTGESFFHRQRCPRWLRRPDKPVFFLNFCLRILRDFRDDFFCSRIDDLHKVIIFESKKDVAI